MPWSDKNTGAVLVLWHGHKYFYLLRSDLAIFDWLMFYYQPHIYHQDFSEFDQHDVLWSSLGYNKQNYIQLSKYVRYGVDKRAVPVHLSTTMNHLLANSGKVNDSAVCHVSHSDIIPMPITANLCQA